MSINQVPKTIPFYYKILVWVNVALLLAFTLLGLLGPFLLYSPIQNYLFNQNGQAVLLQKREIMGLFQLVSGILLMIPAAFLYLPIYLLLFPKSLRDYFDIRALGVQAARSYARNEIEAGSVYKQIEPGLMENVHIDPVNKWYLKLFIKLSIISAVLFSALYTAILFDYLRLDNQGITVQNILQTSQKHITYDQISDLKFSYEILTNKRVSADKRYKFTPNLTINLKSGEKIQVWSLNKDISLKQGQKIVQLMDQNKIPVDYLELPDVFVNSDIDNHIEYPKKLQIYRKLTANTQIGNIRSYTLFDSFTTWLDKHLEESLPAKTVAVNFNLYEEANGSYAVELIASDTFDPNNQDWATSEIFTTRNDLFIFDNSSENTDWKAAQILIEKFVTNYIELGKYGSKLTKYQAVGVGFVDGDITHVYQNY